MQRFGHENFLDALVSESHEKRRSLTKGVGASHEGVEISCSEDAHAGTRWGRCCNLKQRGGIAMRSDRLVRNYQSGLCLASTLHWLTSTSDQQGLVAAWRARSIARSMSEPGSMRWSFIALSPPLDVITGGDLHRAR